MKNQATNKPASAYTPGITPIKPMPRETIVERVKRLHAEHAILAACNPGDEIDDPLEAKRRKDARMEELMAMEAASPLGKETQPWTPQALGEPLPPQNTPANAASATPEPTAPDIDDNAVLAIRLPADAILLSNILETMQSFHGKDLIAIVHGEWMVLKLAPQEF